MIPVSKPVEVAFPEHCSPAIAPRQSKNNELTGSLPSPSSHLGVPTPRVAPAVSYVPLNVKQDVKEEKKSSSSSAAGGDPFSSPRASDLKRPDPMHSTVKRDSEKTKTKAMADRLLSARAPVMAPSVKPKLAFMNTQPEPVQGVVPASRTQPALDSSIKKSLVQLSPEGLNQKIFSYLSANELGRSCVVSKSWCRVASEPALWNSLDLRKLSPSLRVFDELDWTTYSDLSSLGLSIADAPPPDKRKEIPILKRLLSAPIERNAGVTLLTIPKGLTFNTLVKLAKSPKFGHAPMFTYMWDDIPIELGNIAVDKTYRILITNDAIKMTRNIPARFQQRVFNKFGYAVPSMLEAATLIAVTYMSTHKRLFRNWEGPEQRMTYCLEEFHGDQLSIGGYSSSPEDFTITIFHTHECYGVACILQKF